MIGYRKLKKKLARIFRAFEILNVGRYEEENFLAINNDLRAEEKSKQSRKEEKNL